VIIPIYNVIVLLQMVRKSWWWLLLLIIPLVNFVILVFIELAKSLGKGTGFALGPLFLPFIFYPILAFGPAQNR